MTTHYGDQMTPSYGPFPPGSDERRLRHQNANNGLRTCYRPECLTAFDPAQVPHRASRPGRRLPWWFYYCSRSCALLDGYVRDRHRFVTVSEDADGEMTVVLDFGSRGCAA